MSDPRWIPFSFAVVRVVPHVHVGAFVNVGVVVHARTADFLGMRAVTDAGELASLVGAGEVDVELLSRYLRSCEGICAGDPAAGPVALSPPSERFHWLTAPRSDVIQSSPPHGGMSTDPAAELERLFAECVPRGRC